MDSKQVVVTDNDVVNKYVQLRDSARSRGLEFDLKLITVRNLLRAERCFYTGVKFSKKGQSMNRKTVDRVDPSRGYIVGNVVACTLAANGIKSTIESEGIEVAEKMVKAMKSRGQRLDKARRITRIKKGSCDEEKAN